MAIDEAQLNSIIKNNNYSRQLQDNDQEPDNMRVNRTENMNFNNSQISNNNDRNMHGSTVSRNLSMVQPGTIVENKPLLEEVYRCISYNDISSLKAILANGWGTQRDINLIEMRDARLFTVLAYACYKNFEEIFMLLFNHALDKNLKGLKIFDEKS